MTVFVPLSGFPFELGPCPFHPDCRACYLDELVWRCASECARRCRVYPEVQRVPTAYFEAEFGPLDGREHTAEIAPTREKTPAFLVWPELLDDR